MDQSAKNAKVIDEFGRILIPKYVRVQFGIKSGDTLCYEVDADRIIMRRPVERCIFCENEGDIESVMGRPVCKSCVEKFKSEI